MVVVVGFCGWLAAERRKKRLNRLTSVHFKKSLIMVWRGYAAQQVADGELQGNDVSKTWCFVLQVFDYA